MTARVDSLDRRLSVAPMMQWTDRRFRVLARCLTARTLLYTEMVTAQAVVHGDAARLLAFDAAEQPVACQLGGAEPELLAQAARTAAEFGYDEINLNVGCPSDRVQSGRFGACLMAEPALVAECVATMRDAVSVPVTVKHRIGIDGREDYDDMARFVETVARTGCRTFMVHARIAVLAGLSPKENREVPPLRYHDVYRLKRDFPELEIVINGGIQSLEEAEAHLARVDGAMLGRAAYQTPWLLAQADSRVFGAADDPALTRRNAVERYLPYVERRLAEGAPLNAMTRHMLGLFTGVPGARAWRRYLSENACREGAGVETIRQALALVADEAEGGVRRTA